MDPLAYCRARQMFAGLGQEQSSGSLEQIHVAAGELHSALLGGLRLSRGRSGIIGQKADALQEQVWRK